MTPSVRRSLAWSALTLVVVGVLAWSFWPRSVPVETAGVTRGPMRVEVSDEGRTRIREIYQLSAPVAGRLLRIEAHPGDTVTGGSTIVAYLLPTAPNFLDVRSRSQAESAIKSAQAAVDLAAAELRRAQAVVAFSNSDLRRASALAKEKAISRETLERAELARDTALAQLGTARAALQAKQFDLEAAKAALIDPGSASELEKQRASIPLVAPVSGEVLRVLHENEATIGPGVPVVEIGDPTNLEVLVELVSEDAVNVRPGASATITDWGGPGALNAKVFRVEPSGFTKISALGVEEQRVNVRLDITDPRSKWASLADGFRVLAHIVVWQKADVLRVPAAAMFRRGDGWAVFAVRNGRAVATEVRIGKSNAEAGEVLGGLQPGDRVIVHPSDRVKDGVRVSVQD